MPTLRAAFFASISLVGTNALAQPAPPPPAPPPPAAAPGPAPAPAPVPPPPAAAAPEAPPPALETPPATPPVSAEPPPPIAAAPAPEPAAPAEKEAPAFPEKLTVGKNGGFWQPGGLLQFWAFYDHSEENKRSTARLRRAEIRVKGEIAPKIVAYQVMIDAAKTLNFGTTDAPALPTDTSILQDYFITFLSDYADVSLGQFKTQISLEGFTGSSKTILPERSLVSRAYGDRRDVGLKVEKKIGDYFFYSAGVYNGAGLNRLDNNNEKDLSLRLEVYPVEGLTIGAAGAKTVGERDDGQARDRVEGDIRYDANNFRAEAEYIHAWDNVDDVGANTTRVEGHGAYVALGYTFIDRIQPVVRFGFRDPNLDDDENESLKQYAAGVNYLLRGNEMKLSLVGEYFDPESTPISDGMLELMLAAQVSF
jgi:hypothetical protein